MCVPYPRRFSSRGVVPCRPTGVPLTGICWSCAIGCESAPHGDVLSRQVSFGPPPSVHVLTSPRGVSAIARLSDRYPLTGYDVFKLSCDLALLELFDLCLVGCADLTLFPPCLLVHLIEKRSTFSSISQSSSLLLTSSLPLCRRASVHRYYLRPLPTLYYTLPHSPTLAMSATYVWPRLRINHISPHSRHPAPAAPSHPVPYIAQSPPPLSCFTTPAPHSPHPPPPPPPPPPQSFYQSAERGISSSSHPALRSNHLGLSKTINSVFSYGANPRIPFR